MSKGCLALLDAKVIPKSSHYVACLFVVRALFLQEGLFGVFWTFLGSWGWLGNGVALSALRLEGEGGEGEEGDRTRRRGLLDALRFL